MVGDFMYFNRISIRRRLVRRIPTEFDGIGMVNSIDRIPSLCLVSFSDGMESMKSFVHRIGQSFRLGKEFKSIHLEPVTNYKKAL